MKISMWRELMKNIDLDENDEEFNSITKSYSEKHRHYHNSTHIIDCLSKSDILEETRTNYSLKLAIWYHDVVYKTLKKNNELKSAEMALAFLEKQESDKVSKTEVYNLIMATIHKLPPNDVHEAYMMDIDISILGSSPENYINYTAQIRKEYWLIPWFLYKKNRIEIMEMFLNREQLYFTDYYRDTYEENARRNISQEIKRLKNNA